MQSAIRMAARHLKPPKGLCTQRSFHAAKQYDFRPRMACAVPYSTILDTQMGPRLKPRYAGGR